MTLPMEQNVFLNKTACFFTIFYLFPVLPQLDLTCAYANLLYVPKNKYKVVEIHTLPTSSVLGRYCWQTLTP